MKVIVAGMVIAFSSFHLAFGSTPAQCLAGMRKALVEGHFTGPLVCSRENSTFVLAGRTAGDKFAIYDYRYRFRPSGANVMHGGQKILVFQGKRYIGQYALSPPPYTFVTMNGTHVVLETRGTREKVSLDFSKNPPREVLINGEVEVFYR